MSQTQSGQLGSAFVGLIQAFGVLRTDGTPCGQPLSVSTAHALCELSELGDVGQRRLAGRLGLTNSTVSRLVDQLESKGWARRSPDPSGADGRVKLVGLTEEGSRMAKRVIEARAERFAHLLSAVDENERPRVIEALELLRHAAHDLD